MTGSRTGEFLPTANLSNLRLRSRLLSDVRRFFEDRQFWEIETPLLSADTVIDRFIEPISAKLLKKEFWLQTSPEFGMKRLLAAGSGSIYQITRAFRNDEIGPLHNPEFTIVEWYAVDQSYEAGMLLLADLAKEFFQQQEVDRLSYVQAFQQFANLDTMRSTVEQFIECARRQNIQVPQSLDRNDRDQWLNFLLSEVVEPNLGKDRPVILYDYPASQAALAQVDPSNPEFAQRFELYYNGIELANGYHELVDADELRRRNAKNNALRKQDGQLELPSKSYLLDAMDYGLPSCTGVALGFDRLVMLVAGAERLSEVIAFPIERA